MQQDPYTPPETDTRVPPEGQLRPIRGIVLALVFDIVGTVVAVNIAAFFYVVFLVKQGVSQSEIEQIFSSGDLYTVYGFITVLIGLAFSYYSGRICIRVSRGTTLRYAYILAGLGTVLGLAVSFSTPAIGEMLALTALAAVAVVIGAKHALGRATTSN